jgi:molybdopterin converting factor small subunit
MQAVRKRCNLVLGLKTMRVQVKLFSRLQAHLPPETRGEAAVDLFEGATVGQLLAHLGIDEHIKLLSVNSQRETDWDRVLHDGDVVHIFPIVVGG